MRVVISLALALATAPFVLAPAPAAAAQETDHSYINRMSDARLLSLLDGYVRDDARSWSYNRYVPDSMSDLEVSKRGGKVTRLRAYYLYDGFMGRMNGWVEMDIDWDGNIGSYCITYHDYPNTCRPVRTPAY